MIRSIITAIALAGLAVSPAIAAPANKLSVTRASTPAQFNSAVADGGLAFALVAVGAVMALVIASIGDDEDEVPDSN